MTKVFVADIALLGEDLTAYYDKISEYRQRKIQKLKKTDDQKRSLLAEILLAKCLGRKPHYTIDTNGKPMGEEIEFSFSHSGNIVLCAVSDASIGADVEKVRIINPDVAKRFSKDEYEKIKMLEKPEDGFFKLWVQKESLLKLLGKGIKGGLNVKIDKAYNYTMCEEVAGYKICVCANEPAEIEFVREI